MDEWGMMRKDENVAAGILSHAPLMPVPGTMSHFCLNFISGPEAASHAAHCLCESLSDSHSSRNDEAVAVVTGRMEASVPAAIRRHRRVRVKWKAMSKEAGNGIGCVF